MDHYNKKSLNNSLWGNTVYLATIFFQFTKTLNWNKFQIIFTVAHHSIVFDSVIALLQILELQLSDKVLRDTGTLCSDGVQQGVVAEHFFIQQLKQRGRVALL